MADQLWPAGLAPTGADVRLQRRSGIYASPFANGGQVAARAGADQWQAELSFTVLTRRQAGLVDALTDRLGGAVGVVVVPDFERLRPIQQIIALTARRENDTEPAVERAFADTGYDFEDTGNGFVSGAPLTVAADVAAGDAVITVRGFVPGVVVAWPGQTFSVANRLYRVANDGDVVANGSGVASFTCAPLARVAHATGAQVICSRPACRMRLASEDIGSEARKIFSDRPLSFVEALD